MSRKKKKVSGLGVNLAVNLVTLSIVFVLIGYLAGQYWIKTLQQQHRSAMQSAKSEQAAPSFPDLPVVSEAVSTPPPIPPSPTPEPVRSGEDSSVLFKVQVGVFSEQANAQRMVAILKEAGYEAIIVSGPPYRVQTGAFGSEANATKLMNELKAQGFEAIVVR